MAVSSFCQQFPHLGKERAGLIRGCSCRRDGHQAAQADMRLCGCHIQQGPQAFGRNARLALFPADVDLDQNFLGQVCGGSGALHLLQQVLAVHAFNQSSTTHHFVDLVGLQMADKMPRLTAISVGVGLFHQFLHMVFAKQVNGQSGAGNHLFHGASLAGGAQQNICRVAAGFTRSGSHIFTDAGHIFGHHCQLFLCQHGSHLLVNGTAAADVFGAGAGADDGRSADLLDGQAHRHGHAL